MRLVQSPGGVISGTWDVPSHWGGDCLDNAGPLVEGMIDGNGSFEFRMQARASGNFTDAFYRGELSADGNRIIGFIDGGQGFNPMNLDRQPHIAGTRETNRPKPRRIRSAQRRDQTGCRSPARLVPCPPQQ